ncbi:MAG: phytanoyl-CoA dioxygenase family protein [Pseudomonadota bacterium]
MAQQDIFQSLVVKFDKPIKHFQLIVAPDGNFLGINDEGEIGVFPDADDCVIWEESAAGEYCHVVTGRTLQVTPSNDSHVNVRFDGNILDGSGQTMGNEAAFSIAHGPEKLPSEYVAHLKAHGWVCLTCVLSPELVAALEKTACTDRYENSGEFDRAKSRICESVAAAQTTAEPISLWVIRQYMQTKEIWLGHEPGIVVLPEDDGQREVQGWHSDFPYHWGVPAKGVMPEGSGEAVLGVQRNVCISDFTKVRGATVFKLSSHKQDKGPPEAWGTAAMTYKRGYRSEHGLPYSGPDSDVIEAPGGSILIYDARTWHRAGVNRTKHGRSAMLMAMLPRFMMPKNDTSKAYKDFLQGPAREQLNVREKREIKHLMVHDFPGPGGEYVMAPNRELTELFQE